MVLTYKILVHVTDKPFQTIFFEGSRITYALLNI